MNNRIKYLIIVLVLILVVPITFAADWDNIKSYDDKEKQITLYNWNVIGKVFDWKLAEYKLTYNTDQCFQNCEARGTATLYNKEKLFSNIKFKNMKEKLVTVDYKIYLGEYKNITYTRDKYVKVCVEPKNQPDNK